MMSYSGLVPLVVAEETPVRFRASSERAAEAVLTPVCCEKYFARIV
jgi:hypothetical protein